MRSIKSKILGGVLLIVGTSLGAGMLAQPLVTAAGGYFHSLWLLLGIWLITTFTSFLLLEVNLWLPEKTNLISMAKATLGVPGQIITWAVYLLLLYSLLSAYISGGGDLLYRILLEFDIKTPYWLDTLLFTGILGTIVFKGISAVDWANRGLMSTKMSIYFILIVLITPFIQFKNLNSGHLILLSGAVMIVVTSFGSSVIIPSLRTYFNSNVKALRITIALGSALSLLCYLAWDLVVQGSISAYSNSGLIHIATSGHPTSGLMTALSTQLHSGKISTAAHIFSSVCITTSFLGVALCLTDFLSDGMKIKKVGRGRWLVMAVTFVPPLTAILLYPNAFILGLHYAGIFCVILLILIPTLMAISGRYIMKISGGSAGGGSSAGGSSYQVWGKAPTVILASGISISLLIFGIMHLSDIA